jgi:hypothetical protein
MPVVVVPVMSAPVGVPEVMVTPVRVGGGGGGRAGHHAKGHQGKDELLHESVPRFFVSQKASALTNLNTSAMKPE